MSDIVTEHDGSILAIQLNRPAKKNAMTSSMYIATAGHRHGTARKLAEKPTGALRACKRPIRLRSVGDDDC